MGVFLIIDEGGYGNIASSISEDAKHCCDRGYIIIFDLSNLTQFLNGKWIPVSGEGDILNAAFTFTGINRNITLGGE